MLTKRVRCEPTQAIRPVLAESIASILSLSLGVGREFEILFMRLSHQLSDQIEIVTTFWVVSPFAWENLP